MSSPTLPRTSSKTLQSPTLSERLLMAFCRPVDSEPYPGGTARATLDNALDFMIKTVPDFLPMTEGKTVLDFGCGFGNQAAALARKGRAVTGLDLPRETFKPRWTELMAAYPTLRLTTEPPAEKFDVAYSCSAFEHFSDPPHILRLMRDLTKPGGRIVITFAEPWYSPRGHHMDGFTRLPWVNLLFPESTVMRVRSLYKNDGATRYEDVEGGLNRMTVAKFNRIVDDSGMRVLWRKSWAVKGLPLVTRTPVLRELLTAACSVVFEV